MKLLSSHSLDNTILRVLVALCAVLVLSFALMPRLASAAAVSVTAFTATSTNVYVNTGFATTSRVTTDDTVNYQLTLDGTPLIAPEINVFLMGSTTMSGSGTNWYYSTTSAAVWTEGLITFRLGIGGTAGDATTTVTQTALTGTNVTQDETAPTLNSVSWSDVDGSTQFSATDTLTLTFSETMATSTITAGNVDTTLALSGSHTFGTSPTISWNTAGTVLTLTLGTSPTLATADTVDPTTAVKDSVGIADATGAALAITDNVAPNNPTGLADTSFSSSAAPVSVSLASVGSSQIRYTDNSTTPSCSVGVIYSSAISIVNTTTLKAVGCDEAGNASSVVTAVYTRTGSGGGGGSSGSGGRATPAVPATRLVGCVPGSGDLFDVTSGKSCTVSATPATPATPALQNASASARFNRDLQAGTSGDDVKGLQVFLNTHGYLVATTGPGSPGNETDFFGGLTRAAIVKYQKAKSITPAVGYFGPKTRAAVASEQ